MTDHKMLIEQLGREIRPVRRSWKTGWRVLAWLAIAMPCAAVASLLVNRSFTDWSQSGAAVAGMQLLLALSLGTLAIRYAFTLSIAGRSTLSWLALPPLGLIWLGLSLWNLSSREMPSLHHHGDTTRCFTFLMVVSTPMIVLMILSLRRTRSLHPVRSLAMAGLGIASLALSLLTLCHPVEVHPMDFVMHLAASVTIVALTVLVGKRWISVDR